MKVPSSRRSVVKAIGLGVGGVAFAGLGATYWARSQQEGPSTTARFGIARGSSVSACAVPTRASRRRELQVAAWLSFATMAPSSHERLLSALEALADSLEARSHPLGLDLSDESPEELAQREAPWLLPIWTAARTIARRCFLAGDRSLAVVVNPAGSPLPSTLASFDPFGKADTHADLRLARFLSWPISAAVRVKTPADTLAALRARSASPKSALALCIDAKVQSVDVTAIERDAALRLHALSTRLSRFARRKCENCESLADVIDALSAGLPVAPALDWLELGSDEAFVVPRLSAVSRRDAFLRELAELSARVVVSGD